MKKTILTMATLLALASSAALADTVLVTSLQGTVTVEASGLGKTALEAFVRLSEGDRLLLPAGGQVSLVYVGKARLEAWQGAGTIVVGEGESKAAAGKPQVQVRSIPPEAAKQMNKTPSTAPDGRVGMMRMRGIPPHDAITRLENEYKQLRSQSAANDLLPEVAFLAGLFDLRQYSRIEEELQRIERDHPGNDTARSLKSLYSRAIAAGKPAPPDTSAAER